MKKLIIALSILALLLGPAGACAEPTYFEQHGALHVSGAQLTDESGDPVQLRGVSTLGLAWFPEFVNEDAFRTIRDDWGANTVRLAMYTCEDGGYLTGGDQAALEALIDKGIQACAALGMYAIIDWHILSDGDPNLHADEAEDFFSRMSARYADQPHVLYELCNEPNGSKVSWEVVKRYAERMIPVIRKNAPEAVILCGTPDWSKEIASAAADPIDDDNLMYVVHFYAATHKAPLRVRVKRAVEAGVPVFISEFNICYATGDGAIDYKSAEEWRALIEEYGISYMAWSLSNANESAALIRADCDKKSDWTEDELSETGRWLRNVLREDRDRELSE